MIERLAVDSNAVILWFRSGNVEPLILKSAHQLVLPLLSLVSFTPAFTHRRTETRISDHWRRSSPGTGS